MMEHSAEHSVECYADENYVIAEALATINDRRLSIKMEGHSFIITVVDHPDLLTYPYTQRIDYRFRHDNVAIKHVITTARSMLEWEVTRVRLGIKSRLLGQIVSMHYAKPDPMSKVV